MAATSLESSRVESTGANNRSPAKPRAPVPESERSGVLWVEPVADTQV